VGRLGKEAASDKGATEMKTFADFKLPAAWLATLLAVGACAPAPQAASPSGSPSTQQASQLASPAAAAASGSGAAVPVPSQAAVAKPGTAKPGGVLRIGAERDVADLDPHTVRVGWDINFMQNVYSTLVRPGEDLLAKPDLATEWLFKDPQTLVFTLRQGVKFHNGREFTSDDVKYSLDRIRDPQVPSGYASAISSIDSVETPDKYQVIIKLKRPDAAIINNLALPTMAIVAKEAVEPQPVGLKKTMMGTGPFKFKEQIPGQKIVLVKNPDYYVKGQPLLDEIDMIPLLDETARTNALKSGAVDYIEPVPPKDIKALQADKANAVVGGPNLSFVGVSLNTSKKPYDNVKVRQALAYGISRDEVIQKAFDGYAQPLLGPPLIPPYWAGNTDKYYAYDANKAKQLLTEAGYPDGFKTTIKTGTGTSYHGPFAAVVQSELKKVGVDVQIIPQDGAVSNKDWIDGNFDMYPIRWWGADFIDPEGAFRPLFTCKGSYNNSRFCNQAFDQELDKGLNTTAIEDRKAVYKDAMKALAEQQPWVFLVAFDRNEAIKSYVKGYTSYPNSSQYSLRETWLDK
jgi:peptide/nickel transport system substrate-binding protein